MNCVYYLCPSKVASSPRCCSEQSFSSSEWQPLLRHKTTAGRQATSESCIYMRKEWGFFLFVCFGLVWFFWPPHGIWNSQARDQIPATVAAQAAAVATLWILNNALGPGWDATHVPALPRCHQSCCATVETPKECFFNGWYSKKRKRLFKNRWDHRNCY